MQRLTTYINQAMALADLRNLARENPILVQYTMPNGETMIVVVAFLEPNNVTLPFNVCWIVADPESPDFGTMLRRTSADASLNYRNTWMRINTADEMFAEQQYWDIGNGMLLGEVDVPQTSAATVDVRGLFALNRNYTPDPNSPVVVETNDPRMSNARIPADHTHAKLPITMIQGATGINAYHVKIDSINDPLPGHIFVVTGPGAQEGEWIGMWRRPTAADLVYDGPMLESLEIIGPQGGEINEQMPFTFRANALLSDGSRINNVAAKWTIVGNGSVATIGGSSGNFVSLDVAQNEVVRVEARWTQPESGITVAQTMDVTVIDTTIQVHVIGLTIVGLDEITENSEAVYSVIAEFDDGTTSGVTPNTFTSSNPGAGVFDPNTGRIVVGELTSDQTTTISASYTFNGNTVSATMTVLVRDLTVYPLSATIVGPETVDEDTSANYILRVTFTDSTQRDFAQSNWESSNEQAGSIDGNGVFVATANTAEDQQTTISASYTLEGRTVYASKPVTVRDTTVYPRSATIVGSALIREGSTTTYQLRVAFSDNTTAIVNVSNWAISNSAVGSISATTGQLIAAADVATDTQATVSASYTAHGTTVSATLDIVVTDETNYPISARIIGNATMSENTSQTMQFEVTYLDGTKVNEPVNNWASSNINAATISAVTGVLTAAVNLQGDQVTTISASFTAEGRTVTADLAVTVRDVTNYPVSAVINGPNTINEGSQADYTLAVTFADGSTGNRSAVWNITGGNGATVNTSGRVTAPVNVDANTPATLNASFTLDGVTVNAPAKTITIIDTTVYPINARILGGNSINEGASRTFQLEVTFSDATVAIVSPTDWASSDTAVGTINPSSGSFNALEVTGSKTTTISASYTSNGRTVGDEMVVTVLDATNYPVSAVIQGPATVDEGNQATYIMRVTFTDQTVATVSVSDWTSSHESVGVINPLSGTFIAAANLTADATTQLHATYTANGVTVEASLTVTVKDKTVYPVSAVVEGVAVVDSLAESQYRLRVTFEDASSRIVDAVWSSSNAAAGSIDEETGLFTALNNTTGTNISTVVTGTYKLDGRQVSATRTIAVRDLTNYPTGVVITGVNTVMSSDSNGAVSTQFTARVNYTDGTFTNTPVGGTWSVAGANPSDNVGTIDSNGLFTTNPNVTGANRNITIRYQYTEHGRTVNGTKSVALTVVPLPVSLEIQGPVNLVSEVTQAHTARVTRNNGSTANVPATFSVDVASAIATITPEGSLTTKRLAAIAVVTITATYTANGVTVTDTHKVTVAKAVELVSIEVDGPIELNAGNSGQYTVTARYDNGTAANVTASATFSSTVPSAGTFSAVTRGLFSAANVSSDTVTVLNFGYTANGITRTASLNLTVKAPKVVGSALPRYGVATFSGTDFKGSPGGINIYGNPAGVWTGIQQFADQVMINLVPDTNPHRFTLNLGEGEYGYFMHPKSLVARASFLDHGANMPGGFGGMTWTPEGEVPENPLDPNAYAPLEVMYDAHDGNGPQLWVIYRTDWDFLGTVEFTVSY